MKGATRSSRSLRSFFALGSVPGESEEVRDFLQRRLALFALVLFSLTSVSYVIRVFADVVVGTVPAQQVWTEARFLDHLALVVVSGLLLVWIRWTRRSLTALHVFDAVVMSSMTAVLAAMLRSTPTSYRPEMSMFLGMTHVLVARAALVPSTATRTAVTALVAMTVLQITAGFAYAAQPVAPFDVPTILAFSSMWVVMATVSTTVTSRVIYGLHQQVRDAMRLGPYTLEEKIGEGGMGVVYRARHALLRRPTAVKLLSPEHQDDVALARFEREVRETSGLTHPNTIAIYDYGRTPDGLFYYAMEYLDGVDLDTLVRADGAQPAGRVRSIMSQAAAALGEAHRAGLVHRDVKPGNLMLCRRGGIPDFVKVLDFGLVKQPAASGDPELTRSDTLTGTPHYMSPEAIDRRSEQDARSNLYALGAVAYLLLTGSPPFQGRNALDVASQHLVKPVVPPSQRGPLAIPASIEAVVMKCLEKEPGHRFQSAAELQDALDACTGVSTWTKAQAETWWAERGGPLSEARSRGERTEVALPVRVDVARRAGAA